MAEASGIAAGIVMLALLYRLFFRNAEDLFDAIRFWFTPDTWSFFRGEFGQDWFAEIKLSAWVGISAFIGFGVYAAVNDMIASP